jgi:hypothetical protein
MLISAASGAKGRQCVILDTAAVADARLQACSAGPTGVQVQHVVTEDCAKYLGQVNEDLLKGALRDGVGDDVQLLPLALNCRKSLRKVERAVRRYAVFDCTACAQE